MGEKTSQLITPAPAVKHRSSFCATRQSFTSRALVQVTTCQSQDDTESSGGRQKTCASVEGSRFLVARGVPHMPRGNDFWSREHCSDWGADGGGRNGWIPPIKASLGDAGKVEDGQQLKLWGALARGGNTSWVVLVFVLPELPLPLHIHTITACRASWLIMLFSWRVSMGKTNTFIVIRGRSADQLKEGEQFGNLSRPHPNLR